MLWLGPVIVIGGALTVVLASSAIPYQPFSLTDYTVTPSRVCSGGPVKATVTREFTSTFSYLKLTESWLTVNVPGQLVDRPVQSDSAELPTQALHPSGLQTVPSPVLKTAPEAPGVYRVQILAQTEGVRFGVMPVIGSSVFFSNGTVEVVACPPGQTVP